MFVQHLIILYTSEAHIWALFVLSRVYDCARLTIGVWTICIQVCDSFNLNHSFWHIKILQASDVHKKNVLFKLLHFPSLWPLPNGSKPCVNAKWIPKILTCLEMWPGLVCLSLNFFAFSKVRWGSACNIIGIHELLFFDPTYKLHEYTPHPISPLLLNTTQFHSWTTCLAPACKRSSLLGAASITTVNLLWCRLM